MWAVLLNMAGVGGIGGRVAGGICYRRHALALSPTPLTPSYSSVQLRL